MKKHFFQLMLVVVAAISIQACKSDPLTFAKGKANKPVDYEKAIKCVELFKSEITTGNRIMKTEAVGFKKKELLLWINSLDDSKYDELRVVFGIYTPEMEDEGVNHNDINKGTVFLFPFLNGKPARKDDKCTGADCPYIPPYNIGELHP